MARLFTGVNGFLFALDLKTGETIRGFGENGSINLGSGLNTPGVTYYDLLIVGGLGGQGSVRAFDVRTGEQTWPTQPFPTKPPPLMRQVYTEDDASNISPETHHWRISRHDGHLAYHITCEDELPPADREWDVYKMGVVPAPKVVVHHYDPRLSCPKPNVVFVLGGPGSGKGTMCELAELQLGWVHLSTGDLLRTERQSEESRTVDIDEIVAAGKLVPNEMIVTLLTEAMERITRTSGKFNFLLDGFPRSLGNLEAWYDVVGRDAELPTMLYFECPFAELEKRILGRAPYSGRSDDNVESMKLRFDTFKAETMPTIEYFKSQHKCVEVDTSQGREAVYAIVNQRLSALFSGESPTKPLTQRAEILLGLRPYPKRVGDSAL